MSQNQATATIPLLLRFGADGEPIMVSCGQCSQTDQIMQYHCIDVSVHPDWKRLLLEGFFEWNCPHCGFRSDFSYPCRYLDTEHRLTIVLNPNLSEETLEEMNSRLKGLVSGLYCRRAVNNFYAMREMVRIHELSLDDRVIQLMKPLIIGQMQAAGLEVWNGFFSHIENQDEDRPVENIIYMKQDGDSYCGPVYWFHIYLTDGSVSLQGANELIFKYCRNLLLQQGKESCDAWFHHYDLSWAIDFHNKSNS